MLAILKDHILTQMSSQKKDQLCLCQNGEHFKMQKHSLPTD